MTFALKTAKPDILDDLPDPGASRDLPEMEAVMTIDEIRGKLDLPPWGIPETSEPVVFTTDGLVPASMLPGDVPVKEIRTFATGATRDTDTGKLDYEGFLSPLVLERYAEYMHTHRVQPDGVLRDSDNWQKGIPREQYMKSLWRHFMSAWKLHRGYEDPGELEVSLCAMLFNVSGMLHEVLKAAPGDGPSQ